MTFSSPGCSPQKRELLCLSLTWKSVPKNCYTIGRTRQDYDVNYSATKICSDTEQKWKNRPAGTVEILRVCPRLLSLTGKVDNSKKYRHWDFLLSSHQKSLLQRKIWFISRTVRLDFVLAGRVWRRKDYVVMTQMRIDYCAWISCCHKRTFSCRFILIKKRNGKINVSSYSPNFVGLQGKCHRQPVKNLVSTEIFLLLWDGLSLHMTQRLALSLVVFNMYKMQIILV